MVLDIKVEIDTDKEGVTITLKELRENESPRELIDVIEIEE